jgi:uncharacterized protein (TIGR03084 family)
VTGGNPVPGLLEDLGAERVELTRFLGGLPPEVWKSDTPSTGWTVHDQIAHLAHFDEIAGMSVADPEGFRRFRDGLDDLQLYVDGVGARFCHLAPGEMIDWWRTAGEHLLEVSAAADPRVRVPWFGPDMSLASKLTARIMETWAHGQDVYDTVGVRREATARLRHVVRIGVLAFPNSFRTRGLDVPDGPVFVDLEAPDGSRWAFGDPSAADVVRGDAEDFCLVVTQRRHIDDVGLRLEGAVAHRWMEVAQAFAGPAGAGRRPGQFGEPVR